MATLCLGCMESFDGNMPVCPYCGYPVGTKAEESIHLNPGVKLNNRYIIGRALGFGGFGVTYIGWDEELQQKVAIKEYLPSEFSTRMPGQTNVTVFGGEKSEQYYDGLSKFTDQAKRLAKFTNESGIVKIFDNFEENSSSYIVMEYLKGETLADYLNRVGTIPENEAVSILMPVMQSLQVVHDAGILHRDITPENIFLTVNGEAKLIDFGASRYATTSHSRSLTVIIKQGYSPEEQYRSRGDHGPHTDVYSLAATLYKMITGVTPPDAMERRAKYETKHKDTLIAPNKINKQISQNRENAILNALNVRVEDRTPTVIKFINELEADPPAKRIYGNIRPIDRLNWPIWMKISVPAVLAILLTISILLGTGVIEFSNFTQNITIPDGVVIVPEIEGMTTQNAITEIENNNLFAVTAKSVESKYVKAGEIILQTPSGGSYTETGSQVLLTVSSGGTVQGAENGISTVPYIIWDELEKAKEKLRLAGLGEPIIEEKHDDNVTAGQIISQSIESGKKVEEGTVITIVVSLGPEAFDMPNIVGKSKDEATDILTAAGLVSSFTYEVNDSVKENTVTKQSISKGSQVKRGDTVVITLASKTKTIEVINVVGKSRAEAKRLLEGQGFKVEFLENYNNNVAQGTVISQTPRAGTSQKSGTSITVYISKGAQQSQTSTITSSSNTPSINPTPSSTPSNTTSNTPSNTPSNNTPSTTPSTSNNVKVANVVGQARLNAINTLKGQGLNVTVTEQYSSTVPAGNVISQSPSAQTSVAPGSTINIVVSKGQEQQQYFTITFNANGGKVDTPNKTVKVGDSYGTLPTPTRPGCVFDGWYTAKNGGSKVTEDKKMGSNNVTVFAHWSLQ